MITRKIEQILAEHRGYSDDEEDLDECGCGLRTPDEAHEERFGDLLWHEAHVAEQIADALNSEGVEALARVLDPEAFEDHPIEQRRQAAALQWAARRHGATEKARRALAAGYRPCVEADR